MRPFLFLKRHLKREQNLEPSAFVHFSIHERSHSILIRFQCLRITGMCTHPHTEGTYFGGNIFHYERSKYDLLCSILDDMHQMRPTNRVDEVFNISIHSSYRNIDHSSVVAHPLLNREVRGSNPRRFFSHKFNSEMLCLFFYFTF